MGRCWAGVDGCPGGWVMVTVNAAREVAAAQFVRTFAEAAVQLRGAELTLVDIPIGLPSAGLPRDRFCDALAREALGRRASTVFPVPVREAVWAANYEEASRLNQQLLGRHLNLQSWGICPKIREADAVFRLAPGLQKTMRETHPELCFRALNKRRTLENSKKSRAGRRVRRELLRGWTTNLDAALRAARRNLRGHAVGIDDLLDAAAAAVVARMAAERQVGSVPLARETDAEGLTMEIVGV